MDWGLFWGAMAGISAGVIALLAIEQRFRPSRPLLSIDATFTANPSGWIDCRLTISNPSDDPVRLERISVAKPAGWLCDARQMPDTRGGFLPAQPIARAAEIGLLVQPGDKTGYDVALSPPAGSSASGFIDLRCEAEKRASIAISKSWIVRRSLSAKTAKPKI